MKATELRIGNWVEFSNSKGEAYEQIQVGFGDFSLMEEITKLKVPQTHPYYKPIPLTEDWLLKLGFKCDMNRFYDKADFLFTIEKENSGDFTFGTSTAKVHSFKHWIYYVHQLQNLYFALTGKELTIKETVQK